MAKISVIMGSYNHEAYVAQAIQSVLDQTFADFEFLISDDGSVDGTSKVIAKFNDPRIKFFPHENNRGACVVLNELITQAQGDYIAIINSDDYWPQDKLAYQTEFLDANLDCGAIFGLPAFVDHQGNPLQKDVTALDAVFRQPNRNPGQWLRHFFDQGNCLCHPTILIRKECYQKLGLYDNRLRQLPDFQMWIRFCKHYKLHIADKVLIYFRILPGENASSVTPANTTRVMNEYKLIADMFFDDLSEELLYDGFADIIAQPTLRGALHTDIKKILLHFHPNIFLSPIQWLTGLGKLYALLGQPDYRKTLIKDYGIDDRFFHKLMAQNDALNNGGNLGHLSGQALLSELMKRFKTRLFNLFYLLSNR